MAAPKKPLPHHPFDEYWILIDTKKLTLDVYNGEEHVIKFPRIAIGSNGAARHRRRGDRKTPIGRYQIIELDAKSRFRFFMGLNYPNHGQVEQAYRDKVITSWDYQRLRESFREGSIPPQDTPMGGDIGIHGLGTSSRELHAIANWTQGCIAVTNEEIDELRHYVKIGTLVVIQ